jgi:hypothetical protein
MNVYQKHGFENRKAYLMDLADTYGISFETVAAIASVLGPSEDFDGLVSELDDAEYSGMLDDM